MPPVGDVEADLVDRDQTAEADGEAVGVQGRAGGSASGRHRGHDRVPSMTVGAAGTGAAGVHVCVGQRLELGRDVLQVGAERLGLGPPGFSQHQPGAGLRDQALPPEQHHQDQHAAEDEELEARRRTLASSSTSPMTDDQHADERSRNSPAVLRWTISAMPTPSPTSPATRQHDADRRRPMPASSMSRLDVGQRGRVGPGQQQRADRDAPDVAHAAEHDHGQQRDRDVEAEPVREHPADVDGERRRRRCRRRPRRRRRRTAWSASAARPSCWRPARPRGWPARPGRAGPRGSAARRRCTTAASRHEDEELRQHVERAEVLPGQRAGVVEAEEPDRSTGVMPWVPLEMFCPKMLSPL